eukprot:765610-Hanusia_phi.AAC.5
MSLHSLTMSCAENEAKDQITPISAGPCFFPRIDRSEAEAEGPGAGVHRLDLFTGFLHGAEDSDSRHARCGASSAFQSLADLRPAFQLQPRTIAVSP